MVHRKDLLARGGATSGLLGPLLGFLLSHVVRTSGFVSSSGKATDHGAVVVRAGGGGSLLFHYDRKMTVKGEELSREIEKNRVELVWLSIQRASITKEWIKEHRESFGEQTNEVMCGDGAFYAVENFLCENMTTNKRSSDTK